MSATVYPRGGECECRACDRTFTSLTGFTLHQWWHGRKGDDKTLTCLAPEEVGLVPTERRGRTVWQLPGRGVSESLGTPTSKEHRKAAIARTARILGVSVPKRGDPVG